MEYWKVLKKKKGDVTVQICDLGHRSFNDLGQDQFYKGQKQAM